MKKGNSSHSINAIDEAFETGQSGSITTPLTLATEKCKEIELLSRRHRFVSHCVTLRLEFQTLVF